MSVKSFNYVSHGHVRNTCFHGFATRATAVAFLTGKGYASAANHTFARGTLRAVVSGDLVAGFAVNVHDSDQW